MFRVFTINVYEADQTNVRQNDRNVHHEEG